MAVKFLVNQQAKNSQLRSYFRRLMLNVQRMPRSLFFFKLGQEVILFSHVRRRWTTFETKREQYVQSSLALDTFKDAKLPNDMHK